MTLLIASDTVDTKLCLTVAQYVCFYCFLELPSTKPVSIESYAYKQHLPLLPIVFSECKLGVTLGKSTFAFIIVFYYSVTLLASCVMNLHNFPLDSQTCALKIGSCKYCLPSSLVKHLHFLRLGLLRVAIGNTSALMTIFLQ